jgi:hypothetical protein
VADQGAGVGGQRSFAQEPDDGAADALDLQIRTRYQIRVKGVFGTKPDLSASANEGLEGGFIVD